MFFLHCIKFYEIILCNLLRRLYSCICEQFSRSLFVSTLVCSFVCLFVCLFFVCLLPGLRKNYSVDFHKIRENDGTRTEEEEMFRFWW